MTLITKHSTNWKINGYPRGVEWSGLMSRVAKKKRLGQHLRRWLSLLMGWISTCVCVCVVQSNFDEFHHWPKLVTLRSAGRGRGVLNVGILIKATRMSPNNYNYNIECSKTSLWIFRTEQGGHIGAHMIIYRIVFDEGACGSLSQLDVWLDLSVDLFIDDAG